jgi:VCBS repeat-containing protein
VVNDAFTATEDQPLTVVPDGVLGNDSDLENTPLVLSDVTQPAHGTVAFGADGSFTYTPSLHFNGVDSFTYQATDGTLTSGMATVTITVLAVNDAPEATGEAFTATEDAPLVIAAPGLLTNDVDVDGNATLAVAFTAPQHGTLNAGGTGGFTYAPAAGFTGDDSFTYRVSDGFATSGIVTATITVSPVNDAPVAVNDEYSTPVGQTLLVGLPGVLENDQDEDGDQLTASIAVGPSHGSLAMSTNGSFLYTPSAGFHGIDSFTYAAKDGTLSSTAVVRIEVNSSPLAGNDSYETDEDSPLNVLVPGVLQNDSDPDSDSFTAELLTDPAHGTVFLGSDGSFTYLPSANFHGTDSFHYRALDGFGGASLAGTVTITVRPLNDAPAAVGDQYVTDEDEDLIKSAGEGLQLNDSDVDGDTLTVVLGQFPTHGDVTVSDDGALTYVPSANFHGVDSFTYRLTDGLVSSGVATVTITVNSVNDLPEANGESFAVDEDATLTVNAPGLLANDQDLDNDGLTASLEVGPAHGSVQIGSNGSFTYTPSVLFDGTDSFSYVASDGTASSAPAVVTITVNPVNHAPVGADDEYIADQDGTLSVSAQFGVLSNDSDPDGPVQLHASVVAGPQHGSLALNDDGSFVYLPTAGYTGPDSFTYDVSDGTLHDQAIVSLTVQAPGGGEGEFAGSDAALMAYLLSLEGGADLTLSLLSDPSGDWATAVDQMLLELYAW